MFNCRPPTAHLFVVVVLFVVWFQVAAAAEPEPTVRAERVPDGGIQPQVLIGTDGTAHLIYFRGEPAAGDVHYARRGPADESFSAPIRVNSGPGSVIATGTIRGAQLALGQDDRPHIAWNGSSRAQPRGPDGQTPLLYTRLSDDGGGFEPQRNLIESAYGLDGGACIAADEAGRVFVAWHAGDRQEDERRVWLVTSADDGRTFGDERAVDAEPVGACGCCGMRGTVTPAGEVLLLYRSAREDVHRDMYLLRSSDKGASFHSRKLQTWEINACPMSSEAFAHLGERTWGAWETAEQVFVADLSDRGTRISPQAAPGEAARRKYPALAVNGAGQVLLVWTEGTGWNKGGSLAWQVFDEQGRPTAENGSAIGVPVWSFPAAYAEEDGNFVILY